MASSNGLRWSNDTIIFAIIFVVVLLATVLVDQFNGDAPPPVYLTGLLGMASTALFGVAASDKSKRDREISDTADRAEAKADDALGRADSSLQRESEPSQHNPEATR